MNITSDVHNRDNLIISRITAIYIKTCTKTNLNTLVESMKMGTYSGD